VQNGAYNNDECSLAQALFSQFLETRLLQAKRFTIIESCTLSNTQSIAAKPIKNRILLIILGIALVAAVTMFLTNAAIDKIEQDVAYEYGESLNAVMGTTEAALLFWAEQRKSEILRLSENEIIKSFSQQLADTFSAQDIDGFQSVQDAFRLYIQTIDNLQTHDGYQILSPQGFYLFSNNKSFIGRQSLISVKHPSILQSVIYGQTVFVPPIEIRRDDGTVQATAYFLAPVYFEGIVVAIAASTHFPENEISSIMALGRIGESGESYIIDRQARLVSRSRFQDSLVNLERIALGESEILKVNLTVPTETGETPLTVMAESLTQLESAQNLVGYSDYRGIEVIGTWKWLPELQLGMATEIDIAEARQPFIRAKNTIIALVIVTIAVVLLMSLVVIILSHRANKKLMKAANEMEQKVYERTQELQDSTHALEAERVTLQSVLDNIPDPIFCKDSEGRYVRANQSFIELTGFGLDELIGRTDKELYGKDDAEFFVKDDEKLLLSGVTHVVERPTTDTSGNEILYETRKTLILYENDNQPGILGISRDITDRKRFEEAMLNATRTAQEASNAKSEFLARMSHEIRTPMNGVLGMIDLVLDTQLNAEQRHKLKVAKNSASSLLTIINDILDFSRVEAGKLELEALDFNLSHQIETIAQSLAIRSDAKGVELIIDVTGVNQTMVVGDPVRLRQVVTNLLNNAIKFTDQGQIVITAKSTALDDITIVECSIEDSGIGIPESKIENLFDSFTQVDSSTTRMYGGSGLGLAICQRLVDLMEGDIHVESTLGSGSKFTFTIKVGTSTLKEKPLPKSNINSWTTLVVDDNQTNLEILDSQLTSWGVNVILAHDAESALDILKKRVPDLDLIITDMNMPKKDGLGLVSDIKRLEKYKDTKIMMLSSMSFQMTADEFKTLGLDACLMKPVGSSELFNSLSLLSRDETFITENTLLSYTGANKAKQIEWPSYHKVLIVEDNPVNQLVAEGLLKKFGLNYGVAGDGQLAITTLVNSDHDQPYTLILMDCQMPVMDGYRATEIIRSGDAGERYVDIPIIAMTANAMKGDREKCLLYGMNDHVAKPIDTSLLQEAIYEGFKLTPKTLLDFTINSTEPKNTKMEGQIIIPSGLQTMDWETSPPSLIQQPNIYLKSLALFHKHYKDSSFSFPNERLEMDVLKDKLHSIKGSSGNIGVTKLYNAALALERKISENTLVSKDLKTFNDILEESLMDIKLMLDVNKGASDRTRSERTYQDVLRQIQPLVEKSELVPFELVEELANIAKDNLADAKLHAIVEALEDFDYETSKKLIEGKL
jgi:PAS domain S-box-containing protein